MCVCVCVRERERVREIERSREKGKGDWEDGERDSKRQISFHFIRFEVMTVCIDLTVSQPFFTNLTVTNNFFSHRFSPPDSSMSRVCMW